MQMITRRIRLAVAMLGLVAGISGQARAGVNLVLNGGFETGDFSDWTLGGNGGFISITQDAHTGNFAASFGAVGSPTLLSQSQDLATTAGRDYEISFWLKNQGGPTNAFTASFGGTSLISLVNQQASPYTEYRFIATATSNLTSLQFGFRQDPSFWHFDDVVVTEVVPEPATVVSASIAGLIGLGYARRRRPARPTA